MPAIACPPITLTFISDPGHGWLAVPHKLYAILGKPKLSTYSYKGPAEIFAEEDCDTQVIIDAMKAHGIEYTIREISSDDDSFIRALPRLGA